MFELTVKVTDTQEVVEVLLVNLKQAEAIFKGYAKSDFYSIEARYIK